MKANYRVAGTFQRIDLEQETVPLNVASYFVKVYNFYADNGLPGIVGIYFDTMTNGYYVFINDDITDEQFVIAESLADKLTEHMRSL